MEMKVEEIEIKIREMMLEDDDEMEDNTRRLEEEDVAMKVANPDHMYRQLKCKRTSF